MILDPEDELRIKAHFAKIITDQQPAGIEFAVNGVTLTKVNDLYYSMQAISVCGQYETVNVILKNEQMAFFLASAPKGP